jgi:integrase
LARALAWHARGHRFESDILHQTPFALLQTGFFLSVTLFVTVIYGMSEGKNKNYVLAKLTKSGLIEFYAFDETTCQLKRKQVRTPAKYTTPAQKSAWAKSEIKKINELLIAGYCFKSNIEKETPRVVLPVLQQLKERLASKLPALRKKTAEKYASEVKKLEGFLTETKNEKLTTLSNQLASQYQDFLLQKNQARTINNGFTIINVLLTEIAARGYAVGSFRPVKLQKTESNSNVAFSLEHQTEIEAYLLANDRDIWLFTRFLYHAFVRPRELRQLEGKHLNFSAKTITVPGAISKNKKNELALINSTLCDIIVPIPLPKKMLFGASCAYGGGGQCGENTAYYRHAKVLEKLNLQSYGYTLYSWKHTGAVRAFQSGVNLKKLQRLLRHSSVAITDIYLRSLNVLTDNETIEGW